MQNLSKVVVLSLLLVFAFGTAKPAKAFYLEVPQSVKNLLSLFQSNKTAAQEASTMDSQTSYPTPPPTGDQYQNYTSTMPPQDGNYQQPPNTMQNPPQGMMPPSGDQGQYSQDPQGMQQDGPSPEQQAKQLAQMKRGTKQMASQLKQFDTMITSAEKKGITVPEEVKANLAKAKSLLGTITQASSMEDLQDVDMSEMGDLMQSLDEFRRDVMEKQQRLDGMKRGMKGMEQGLKMFKTQIARLTKQKITVPSEVADNITKLEAIITAVKTAKTSEDMEAIDFDSMQDLMQSMDENRQQLETLARWPQTLKQINAELTRLTREQTKSKTIVDRLAKKGIDLQAEYTAFADAVSKLKSVRDDAVAKMAAGDSEGAFSALQDDFFGQMEDVWQNQKIIMTMSNLGSFASEFKRSMAQANSMIRSLKTKKIDTADLSALILQANEKGQEVLALLKAKPLDVDAVTGALDELENIKQEFESKVDELAGTEDTMPWEKGPQQFKNIDMPQGFDKLVPQKQAPQTQQSSQ